MRNTTTQPDVAEPSTPAPPGRRARVRNRLLVGVGLTAVAVLAAGAPAVVGAAQDLGRSQELLRQAESAQRAVSLAHTLANERDALVPALAGGIPAGDQPPLSDAARARADRGAARLRPHAPRPLARELDGLDETRERALAGESTPAETHAAYTDVITELDALTRAASRGRPARAADPTADALPDLARAVDASAATRTLLAAGLRGPEDSRTLAAQAQRARAREASALADFTAVAGDEGRDAYQRTVTGPAVQTAEEHLAHLERTAQPHVPPEDGGPDLDALDARTELQRGVLSSLSAAQTDSLADLRDDDLTALQLRGGLLLAALLLAVAVSVRTARTLTRPLAAVRLGSRRVAEDPAGQDPVRYTGRNDEFAEVVAAVNALHARAVSLHRQAVDAVEDRGGLDEERDRLAAERDELRGEQEELSARLAVLHGAVHGTFAHHAQRILTLVGEQLSVIGRLEEHETDPDQLATLFTVDHLAARVRRHSENMLLLAGAADTGPVPESVPLIDVLRAAMSEIERYELVEIDPLPPPLHLPGAAARDVSHLLAELLDNATAFSPPDTRVRLTGSLAGGQVTLRVTDEGSGMTSGRLAELNARLADPAALPPPGEHGDPGVGMGLYTVARLVGRHGLTARLHARREGGIAAEVLLPVELCSQEAPEKPAEPDARKAPAQPSAEPPAQHARAADDQPGPAAPAPRTPARTDPEELRRRLGGFQRGARAGHRDADDPAGETAGAAGEELAT